MPYKAKHRCPLYICEDNEAVVQICAKGRSAAMRHLPRVHRIACDWIYELVKFKHVRLVNVKTDFQIADMFTKAVTKSDIWRNLLDMSMIFPRVELGRRLLLLRRLAILVL